jgi:hypothetical protein
VHEEYIFNLSMYSGTEDIGGTRRAERAPDAQAERAQPIQVADLTRMDRRYIIVRFQKTQQIIYL